MYYAAAAKYGVLISGQNASLQCGKDKPSSVKPNSCGDGSNSSRVGNTNQKVNFIITKLENPTVDEHGWVNVNEMIEGVNRTHPINMETLEEIVRTDNKKRYSFNQDKTLIRANQGHSIAVDVELKEKIPPEYLWHGTGEKYVKSIDEIGLIPKSRLYVHLSTDMETAVKVGNRHGRPVVYQVNAGAMAKSGYKFYCSVNGVWLKKKVPTEFLEKVE